MVDNVGIKASSVGVILLSYVIYVHWPVSSPVVKLKDGDVQGIVSLSRGGREFYEYLAIPFAKPPVGILRFEDPEPPQPWEGIRSKWSHGPFCLQYESFILGQIFGSEDCLYLNVFTPKDRTEKLPVMVYIHGGYFQVGSPTTAGPKNLMDEDVILVSVAYRVGVLGFLSTGDDAVRGNMGLKDQTLALKWVQSNIEAFGGDSKKVTIFGESAGGASVHFHILSPKSSGLFQRAIHQSGSSLDFWTVNRDVKEQSKGYAKKLGCSTDSSDAMIACMKQIDSYTLIAGEFDQRDFYRKKNTYFVPTVEAINDDKTFLGKEPSELLKSGQFNKIPILAGLNANEGLLISPQIAANETKLNEANDQWESWAPTILQYTSDDPSMAKKLRKFYFGDTVTPINSTGFMQNFTNMIGDRFFSIGIVESIRLQSKFAPTYTYHLEYEAKFSIALLFASTQSAFPTLIKFFFNTVDAWFRRAILGNPVPHLGACHGDEHALLFSKPWVLEWLFEASKDENMSKEVCKLWTDFAKDKKSLKFRGVQVPLVGSSSSSPDLKFLRISNDAAIIDNHYEKRRLFWESLNIKET